MRLCVRRLAVLAVGSALGATAAALPASPAQAARSPWRVSIHADSPTVRVGTKVHLTGTVARAAAGRLVMLQERRAAGKPWRNQRNALVRRDGTYRTYDIPTDNHARSYRVVMPATTKHRRGVSRSVQVVAYAWEDLTNLAPVNENYLDEVSSVDMNGTSFAHSLEAFMYDVADPQSQSVEYNLDHKCTKFRGFFGISDDSETGGQATVAASADGTSWYSKSFDLGEYERNTHTWATAPLKIRFDTTSDNSDAEGLGAVGTPEVLCTQ